MLNRLSLGRKFLALGVVALVLIFLPVVFYVREADKSLDLALAESRGIAPLNDLSTVIRLTQQHRGLASIALNSRQAIAVPLLEKQKKIDTACDLVDAQVARIDSKLIKGEWSSIHRDWLALGAQVTAGSLSAAQSFQAHVDLIARLLAEQEMVADYYGLSLDPDSDSYHLIQFMYYQLPYLTEVSGQMRAMGAGLLAKANISMEDGVSLSTQSGRVHDRFDLVAREYGKAAADPAIGRLLEKDFRGMSDLTNGALRRTHEMAIKPGPTGDSPTEYFNYITQVVDSQFRTDTDAGEVLRGILAEKIAKLRNIRYAMFGAMGVLFALGALIQYAIARSVSRPALYLLSVAEALTAGADDKIASIREIAAGNLDHSMKHAEWSAAPDVADSAGKDEMSDLLRAIVRMSEMQNTLDAALVAMSDSLRASRKVEQARDWLKTGLNELNGVMRGEVDSDEMAVNVLSYLARRLRAGVGMLYLFDAQAQHLKLASGYALDKSPRMRESMALDDTPIGLAAKERRTVWLSAVPPGILSIRSATGAAAPNAMVALPMVHADGLVGVIVLGTFTAFSEREMDFLETARESIAIGFGANQSRQRLQMLLVHTEEQSEELRVQQEELQASNEELEERADMLESQREQIRVRTAEIEAAGQEIQRKAEELEKVSAYKSEFLANMSHELRTPLNSMLILSKLLEQNKEGRLTPKQVEFAATIHGAGRDLLNLIGDILDLSKIESGRLDVHIEDFPVTPMVEELTRLFRPVAEQQQVEFRVGAVFDAASTVRADPQRTQQIVKNLLGNAFKFTAQGQVSLTVGIPEMNPLPVRALAIAIGDSGIGIAADKYEHIFQAFRQADGSTSRKYGGTGLGLSISRQLARAMGGDITVSSIEGRGSTFTLYLPLGTPGAQEAAGVAALRERSGPARTESRERSGQDTANPAGENPLAGRKVLLVDDDVRNVFSLSSVLGDKGMRIVEAANGREALAELDAHPDIEIVLMDIMMPEMDGYEATRRIRANPRHAHLPVIALTAKAMVGDQKHCLDAGASDYVSKPIDIDRLLAVMEECLQAKGD